VALGNQQAGFLKTLHLLAAMEMVMLVILNAIFALT
jgi:hypothetical protein